MIPRAAARFGGKHALVLDLMVAKAESIVDAFSTAVAGCGRSPAFRPRVTIATTDGATRYDALDRAIVLVPYAVLPAGRRVAMDRFASIGTLGLSGRDQYLEVFTNLLVAHELGHWIQELAQRPLSRWQAEYEANRAMVAFWTDYPAPPPAASTQARLANFVAQPPTMRSPVPENLGASIEEYFNDRAAEIERDSMAYAAFQKMMVRQALAEDPAPSFSDVVRSMWPA